MPLVIAAIIFLLIKKNRSVTGPTASVDMFLNEAYKWLSDREGGLSNGSIGGDQNAVRAPCNSIKKNGVIMDPPPHTNRGVQWRTFNSLAPVLGYSPTCENFEAMPENLWRAIVNWYFEKGLSYSSNPVIAAYIGLWFWGGWDQKIVTTQDAKDIITSNKNLDDQLYELVQLRKYYFSQLPYSETTINAWQDRADKYYNTFNKYV